MMQALDRQVKEILKERIILLEEYFVADCIFYYGPIYDGALFNRNFSEFIESLKQDSEIKNRLVVILNTLGGSVESVEKIVEIIRYHYEEVYFIVPDQAMSAGTILCMSGDKIYMEYRSSLGPIDPQIINEQGGLVPALGYLDWAEKMIEKSAAGKLTEAEFFILKSQDWAILNKFEQAKNLTITLLKKWLVDYKFKNWTEHQTNPERKGKSVTPEEKKERAEEIATILSDNKIWHSHGRKIGIETLQTELKLKIEDYSNDEDLRKKIRNYNDFITDYIMRHNLSIFLHNRKYFLT